MSSFRLHGLVEQANDLLQLLHRWRAAIVIYEVSFGLWCNRIGDIRLYDHRFRVEALRTDSYGA